MPFDLSELLVVAISSSALFDTRESHLVFTESGLEAYVNYQLLHEEEPLAQGAAFPLISALLRLNKLIPIKHRVEVVILSQNEPEAGLRIMNSVEHHKLEITRAAFTGGEPVARYLHAYKVSLFLSRNEEDVREAIELAVPAGLLYDAPSNPINDLDQLRIAFDGDAVLFSDDSERIYQEKGINAFFEHERQNALKPLPEGPFAPFLKIIARIQNDPLVKSATGIPPIRTALVTARNSPAHKRAILTLRAWNIKINEMFFLGGISKDQVLHKFRPHIFFDDQDVHAKPASRLVPSARVPIKKRPKIIEGQPSLSLD
jgi:5'-nucleotidase